MKGATLLAVRHAVSNPAQTIVLALCVALALALPITTTLVVNAYQDDLVARADTTPFVAGARGNRFDLTLALLYFRESTVDTVPFSLAEEINASGEATAIPISRRFTAREQPIVGVTPEYFDLRNLRPAQGARPVRLGDATLGARAAKHLDAEVGGAVFSDQREAYDISRPPALKMRVAGVLEPTGTPDDDAVFVDINTVWILEGASHGHGDVRTTVADELVLRRTDDHTAVSQAMLEYNEVTDSNIHTFHVHGDEGALPLTGIIVLPRNDKAATLLRTRTNAGGVYQIVRPAGVIDELLRFVFRIKTLIDTVSVLLAASTILLIALVLTLSVRIRRDEINTLHRIGCARWTVVRIFAIETAFITAIGLLAAAILATAVILTLPSVQSL